MSDREPTELEQEFEERQEPEPTEEPAPEVPEEEVEEAPEASQDPELEQARRLYTYFQQHPEMAENLVKIERGEVTVAPVQQPEPQEPEIPDFWSAPDKAYQDLYQRVISQEQYIAQKQLQDDFAAIETGQQVFAQQHPELSPEDVARVASRLRDEGILPTYWGRSPNFQGVTKAMEVAYQMEFFDRSKDVVAKDIANGQKAKRRAASVGMSQRSSARVEPTPTNDKERKDAMIREISEAMGSNA